MRPTDETDDRAGAAQPLDASADRSNETKQTEPLRLRDGEKVHGPYQHRARWRLHIRDADGKERRIAFDTREAAALAMSAIDRKPSTETVDDAVTEYLRHLRSSGRIKERTKTTHWERMRAFFRLGGTRAEDPTGGTLRQLDKERAQGLYDKLCTEVAVDTHRNSLTLAKAFGAWCVKEGKLRENPLANIEPRGRRRQGKEQLRVNEARKLIATCCEYGEKGDAGAIAVMTALMLGLRASEVVERVVRDLDDNDRLLWIPKAKTEAGKRTLEIPAFLRPYLRKLANGTKAPPADDDEPASDRKKGPTDRLFTNKNRHWLRYHTGRMCDLAGVKPVCAHSLRGLHSTLATEHGATGHVVAKALEHTSYAVTKKHYVQPGTVERVAQGKVVDTLGPRSRKSTTRARDESTSGELEPFPVPHSRPDSIV